MGKERYTERELESRTIMSRLWIPNFISLIRIFLAPLISLLALKDQWFWSFVIFLTAWFSDWLDGWFAIKFDAKSKIGGKYLDPIADLIMLIGAFGGLVLGGIVRLIWIPCLLIISFSIGSILYFLPESSPFRMFVDSINAFGYLLISIVVVVIYAYKACEIYSILIFISALPLLIVICKLKQDRLLFWYRNFTGYLKR